MCECNLAVWLRWHQSWPNCWFLYCAFSWPYFGRGRLWRTGGTPSFESVSILTAEPGIPKYYIKVAMKKGFFTTAISSTSNDTTIKEQSYHLTSRSIICKTLNGHNCKKYRGTLILLVTFDTEAYTVRDQLHYSVLRVSPWIVNTSKQLLRQPTHSFSHQLLLVVVLCKILCKFQNVIRLWTIWAWETVATEHTAQHNRAQIDNNCEVSDICFNPFSRNGLAPSWNSSVCRIISFSCYKTFSTVLQLTYFENLGLNSCYESRFNSMELRS